MANLNKLHSLFTDVMDLKQPPSAADLEDEVVRPINMPKFSMKQLKRFQFQLAHDAEASRRLGFNTLRETAELALTLLDQVTRLTFNRHLDSLALKGPEVAENVVDILDDIKTSVLFEENKEDEEEEEEEGEPCGESDLILRLSSDDEEGFPGTSDESPSKYIKTERACKVVGKGNTKKNGKDSSKRRRIAWDEDDVEEITQGFASFQKTPKKSVIMDVFASTDTLDSVMQRNGEKRCYEKVKAIFKQRKREREEEEDHEDNQSSNAH